MLEDQTICWRIGVNVYDARTFPRRTTARPPARCRVIAHDAL
jgi:hypothetical protein